MISSISSSLCGYSSSTTLSSLPLAPSTLSQARSLHWPPAHGSAVTQQDWPPAIHSSCLATVPGAWSTQSPSPSLLPALDESVQCPGLELGREEDETWWSISSSEPHPGMEGTTTWLQPTQIYKSCLTSLIGFSKETDDSVGKGRPTGIFPWLEGKIQSGCLDLWVHRKLPEWPASNVFVQCCEAQRTPSYLRGQCWDWSVCFNILPGDLGEGVECTQQDWGCGRSSWYSACTAVQRELRSWRNGMTWTS